MSLVIYFFASIGVVSAVLAIAIFVYFILAEPPLADEIVKLQKEQTTIDPRAIEIRNATLKEAARNDAEQAYFKARHEMLDTIHNRRIFEAGFDRGYDMAFKTNGSA